ncbi:MULTISPECIES: ArsR/SmtB family transcription factor [Streptomyces]|uniref:ArsR/SmtB family transcription factor n=1 Tax=Streptomyces TaxID=1883 RepID=UPI0019074BFD|nr:MULTISPECIES: winged helix-turn-helix domain-containing protein [unclassified Streptomyces]MCU4745804.1 winged helix-turn-helix domain-containing protein [Streptomyces sp. G-5]QQN79236.1 winged helix-turn-helix transcriptional regulator [Streptomyces sp. XC 2026]
MSEGLEERVAALESRVAALESGSGGADAGPAGGGGSGPAGDFWALEGLRARLPEDGTGGVLFTGSARLPTEEFAEWQFGLATDTVLAADWEQAAESFAALGHPVRMRLLREIVHGRRTVAELAALEDLGTTGQIYHHLRQLTTAGWLHTPQRGRHEIPVTRVIPLLAALAITQSPG